MKTSGVLDYRNKEVREEPGRQRSRTRRAGPEKRMTLCKGGVLQPGGGTVQENVKCPDRTKNIVKRFRRGKIPN